MGHHTNPTIYTQKKPKPQYERGGEQSQPQQGRVHIKIGIEQASRMHAIARLCLLKDHAK